MFRREFIHRAAVGGAAGLGTRADGRECSTVTFEVTGFTCVTCAIGLQVVLGEQPGVVRAKADYKGKRVSVDYDSEATSPDRLRDFINQTTGFKVAVRRDQA